MLRLRDVEPGTRDQQRHDQVLAAQASVDAGLHLFPGLHTRGRIDDHVPGGRGVEQLDDPATVIQACKRPPTDGNEEAIENALQWLDPLKKPDRIENAPNVESLRRELQLFYLERSRRYGWAHLPWEEVVLTGALLGEDEGLVDEVVGGVDLVPYLVAVHDAQRGRWMILDLTFSDGVAKELMIEVIGKRVPSLLGRAGKSTLGF